MKTRMHRFWLSITLAAGSLASPLCGRLPAHDLPWRWASDTVSSSDWNYLHDDCLDSRPLSRYGDALSRSLECSLGTCPAEEDEVANRFDAALAHRSTAKFASEVACWATKWEQIQKKAGEVACARLAGHRQEVASRWAVRPELGVPPAPAPSIADTCSFGAEYGAMQAAADLLDAEVARAAEQSAKEAELRRALADAAQVEAAAVDVVDSSELPLLVASKQTFCGGETQEIVSQEGPHSDFAPPVDEYMVYDLDGRESHWLGGLGKSWRLQAAVSASAAQAGLAASESSAADSFGADELIESCPAVASQSASSEPVSEIIEAPVDDEFALCDFVGPIAPKSWPKASRLIAAKPEAGVAPAPSRPLFALKDRLSDGLEWVDLVSCVMAAEMCGMDQAHRLGEQWGEWSRFGAQRSMTTYVAMGHYLSLPPMVHVPSPDLTPKSDVYVVYTDSQGSKMTAPASLAEAWNAVTEASQQDAALDEASYLLDEFAAFESHGAIAAGSEPAVEPASELSDLQAVQASHPSVSINLAQLRRHVLSLAARELDALGMSCLQTADQLSNWADPQIASREDNDVR